MTATGRLFVRTVGDGEGDLIVERNNRSAIAHLR
jgi:hypothetical protein